jgi:hypothetical protein
MDILRLYSVKLGMFSSIIILVVLMLLMVVIHHNSPHANATAMPPTQKNSMCLISPDISNISDSLMHLESTIISNQIMLKENILNLDSSLEDIGNIRYILSENDK